MKIVPQVSPTLHQPSGSRAAEVLTPVQRALNKLAELNGAQTSPVQDPTRLAPEEMTVVRAPSASNEGQKDTIEAPITEAPPAEASQTVVDDKPLSSQYAILARKEKAIRQREQQLKAREAAIRAQEEAKAATATKPAIDESKYVPKDRLTQDPFTVLNELGLSYEQLTELALNAPKPEQLALQNELKALREEIKLIKGETEGTKKTFEEQQKAQRDQAVNQIRADVRNLVQSDPAFETIRETRSIGDVVELITKTFDEDGILLTVEEAAQEVEAYLVDEAIKIARLKKVQQRLAPKAPQAPVAGQKTTAQPEKQPIKTLTNAVSSSQPLSKRERAILAFEGKLNKN